MTTGNETVVPDASASGTTGRGRPEAGRAGRLAPPSWLAVAFLVPALILLGALVVYPILYTLYRSFFDASGSGFVGGANYKSLFTDHQNLVSIRNTAIWVVVAPILVTVLGLIFAVLTERIKWASAFKLIVFMPMAVSFLASGVIFQLVYQQDPGKGVANAIVTSVHDTFLPSSQYPGAQARPKAPMAPHGKGFVTRTAATPGHPVALPLVGMQAGELPGDAAKAAPPAVPSGRIGGTVWLDFTRGGGGAKGTVDATEKGMPGVTVQALAPDGSVAATTKTEPDGSFTFTGLSDGSYKLVLPAANFKKPFNGISWLGSTLITPSIIGAYIWVWAGFSMVLIAAGLAAMPRESLEAARVDGATEWQVFRRVTMPLLSPVLTVVFITMIIYVLKVFDLVYIIGYGNSNAEVLAVTMWRDSFGGGSNQGLGSAVAILIFALVIPAMIYQIRGFRKERQR